MALLAFRKEYYYNRKLSNIIKYSFYYIILSEDTLYLRVIPMDINPLQFRHSELEHSSFSSF